MTHTPAPWNVHNNIGRKGELGIIAAAAPCIIAIMGNQREYRVEANANARLISAAPELLEALASIIGNKPYGCTKHAFITVEDCYECKKYELARAAIAKAEG